MSQTIQIIPDEQFPFKIKKVTARKGQKLRFELKPLPPGDGPVGYQLVVHNTLTKPLRGYEYKDHITIETDITAKPRLKILVVNTIHKPSPQAQKKGRP